MASSKPPDELLIIGDITKALRQAWNSRVGVIGGQSHLIREELCIRQLFHDLGLYPSKSQVYEMVHCARKGEVDNDFLTFGEFCIFATELKRYYQEHGDGSGEVKDSADSEPGPGSINEVANNSAAGNAKKNGCSYDIFLGGSCDPTTWRKDLAIPHFKAAGITFYNPQVEHWVPELIELEHQAKQTSRLLFFVANEKTRNVVSMIEISYLAGKKRTLICCLSRYPENHSIRNERLSATEWADLQGGMTVVYDLVERQGIPVFDNLAVALQCATKVIKDSIKPEDLSLQDGAKPVIHADMLIGDKLVSLREAFDQVDTARTGKISVGDLRVAFKIHVHRDLSSSDLKRISSSLKEGFVDFNSFCCIVAEFKYLPGLEGNEAAQPKHDRSKRRRVRDFFGRVFHRRDHLRSNQDRTAPVQAVLNSRRGSSVRDVYLGGSANGSWRKDNAVPFLKKHGLTYFNPQAVSRRLMPMWAAAIENCRVLLFVILGNSRSVGAMNEAAFYIGQGLNVVLVVQNIQADDHVIGDVTDKCEAERLSTSALKDYNRGRSYLSDFANREGIPVFDKVEEALQCVVDKCKN